MSFASPYWLQSWEDTQSPFKNMGLWEFCFYKFRHPDYQFDHLFHGCHPLYGKKLRRDLGGVSKVKTIKIPSIVPAYDGTTVQLNFDNLNSAGLLSLNHNLFNKHSEVN